MFLLLTLLASSPDSLAGTRWALVQIAPRGEAITPGTRLRKPSLIFLSGSHLLYGDTGCNGYAASWQASGQTVRVTGMHLKGDGMCPDHPLALESDFIGLLEKVNTFKVSGSTLTLSGPQGTFMTFKRLNSP